MNTGLKMTILSFTDRGAELAERVMTTEMFSASHRRCSGGRLKEMVSDAFESSDAILFIGAAGIAVRAIAPFVKSKLTDPAVLVADEFGRFVIPILSGHVGGANEIATMLSENLGMTAVITTATDINGALSIDTWAVKHRLTIENAPKIKGVSMKVLSGQKIRVLSEAALDEIPDIFELTDISGGEFRDEDVPIVNTEEAYKGLCGTNPQKPDVYIGVRTFDFLKDHSLCLTPKMLYIGIGCRRGTPESAISALFEEVFSLHHLSRNAVAGIASIDLKADEAGLINFCKNNRLPLRFFSSDELLKLHGSYEFSSSSFVRNVTGVDSVCERAAVKFAEVETTFSEKQCFDSRCPVRFLQKKMSKNGVTIAVAVQQKSKIQEEMTSIRARAEEHKRRTDRIWRN